MRKIAFVNEKGGTCKTTLAVNVSAFLALEKRLRVLLVDMDPQGQVGKALGIDVRDCGRTVHDLLSDPKLRPTDVIQPSRISGLDLIISNKALIDFPVTVAREVAPERKLQQKFDGLEGYDYLIFDSPPSLGLTTINILLAVDEIIIPVALTYFALDGCCEIVETINSVSESFERPDLRVSMVIPTFYRNTRLADEILEKLKEHFGGKLARTVIRYNVRIDEAQSHGLTIWEYDPASAGAEMLREVSQEVLRNAKKGSR
ncbi:ParA family protein [Candidatus Poribacteria bacterium]|nr:ParA family protein [Candidatus Poribacteria bacterium]